MQPYIEEVKKIGLGVIIAIVIFGLSTIIFNTTQSSLLAVIAFLVVLWTNEALPLAIVSLMPIVIFDLMKLSGV